MDTTTLNVGDIVQILKGGPFGDTLLGTTRVLRVLKTGVVTEDGNRWKRSGYIVGAHKTRGIGYAFERRIEKV